MSVSDTLFISQKNCYLIRLLNYDFLLILKPCDKIFRLTTEDNAFNSNKKYLQYYCTYLENVRQNSRNKI